jgi:hypothetical protein
LLSQDEVLHTSADFGDFIAMERYDRGAENASACGLGVASRENWNGIHPMTHETMSDLRPFEAAVLAKLLDGAHPALSALREQLLAAKQLHVEAGS